MSITTAGVAALALPLAVCRVLVRKYLARLHVGQKQALGAFEAAGTRLLVLFCGRRWGKSTVLATVAVAAAMDGQSVWWIAPTFPIAKIGWRMLRVFARSVPGVTMRVSDLMILFASGGSIQVKSADNPDSLRGEGLDLALLDEAAFMDQRVWTEAIRPALADRRGKAIMGTTPNGHNWVHDLFLLGQGPNDQGVVSLRFRTADNPFIAPEEIEAMRRDMPPAVFAQEAEAIPGAGSGYVEYERWLACQVDGTLTWAPGDKRPVILAVDAAKNDDHMALVGVRHGEWSDDAGGYVPEVCYVQEWTPGPEGHDPGDIRRAILALRERGMVIAGVAYDPYQWVESARILGRAGVWAIDFDQQKRREEADTQLRRLIRAGCVRHDGDAALAHAIMSAASKEYRDTATERYTCRIVKGDGKVDALVALSMAVDVLGKTPR